MGAGYEPGGAVVGAGVLGQWRVTDQASTCSQAVSAQARLTMAHQIRFWSMSCSGRFFRPVSLAARIRSSQRARQCRSSHTARAYQGDLRQFSDWLATGYRALRLL